MKTVYLVRHAKSSWADMSLPDRERPLNKRGLRDAPFMAQLLEGKGLATPHIISSPAKRAWDTAAYFAKELNVKEVQSVERIYGAGPTDLLDIIAALPDEQQQVMLFGHNPTMTTLANLFSEDYIANVPTCGILHIEAATEKWADFNVDNGKLVNFHYPKQYFD